MKANNTPPRSIPNGAMFTEERRMAILAWVKDRKKATVAELAARFSVSAATIRTDLRELELARQLTRTHGGAMDADKTRAELSFDQRQVQHREAKRAIAEEAAAMIDDGDTIVLDNGSTTYELAARLAGRFNLTVVTNDLNIARLLEDTSDATVLFVGGLVRRGSHCTLNIRVPTALAHLNVDKAFMATTGFSPEKGATIPDVVHAEDKRQMISMARRVILLCDSSKMGKVYFARFAETAQIHTLITDRIAPQDRKTLEAGGMTVIASPADVMPPDAAQT
ncbi:MAG: DeoR/GlpR family DNA-binding transcription regulator [Kiritimatiellae bacterium]|nr:DeoR/GlpR family DNA-binding transcription regulator [Kiritimatiellia bacterium]